MSKLLQIIAVIVVSLILLSLASLVVMLLWNWVAVALFNAPRISFWMALGVFVIIRLIVLLFTSK